VLLAQDVVEVDPLEPHERRALLPRGACELGVVVGKVDLSEVDIMTSA
jgi:hypothetical protein